MTCSTNIERLNKGPDNWRAIIDSSVDYSDVDFPPTQSSLEWKDHLRQSATTNALVSYYDEKITAWKRPRELMDKAPQLWSSQENSISPLSIIPSGKLADIWLLSALSALAEKPERIKKLFVVGRYAKEGVHALRFYHKAEPTFVTIDDRLPVMDNGWPVNARQSVIGDWWVPLIEKAFAKMNVNYANLHGGMQYEAMRALTG